MVQVQESIRGLRVEDIDADAMRLLKQYGTSDAEIAALTGSDERFGHGSADQRDVRHILF